MIAYERRDPPLQLDLASVQLHTGRKASRLAAAAPHMEKLQKNYYMPN